MSAQIRSVMVRRCINCSFVVPRQQQVHSLDELSNSMLNVLSSWIAPGSVNGGILCHECFALIQASETLEVISPPQFGHQHVCFGCGSSILRSRSYRVSPECQERNIIIRWVPVHQVSRLERVCAACWRSTNREEQRQLRHAMQDANRPVLQEIGESSEEFRPDIPVPPPLPPQLHVQSSASPEPKITSAIYRRVAGTSRHCIFLNCQQPERLMVPKIIREMLLIQNKIYVPSCARICRDHLDNGRWSELTTNLCDFTGPQFDVIMTIAARAHKYRIDFDNISVMPHHLCHYWLGMNADQFDELLACVPSLSREVNNPRLALCIFIVKLRTGESNERLSSLFQMPRATLERKMKIARMCLFTEFVPSYLGFDHLSAEQVASRNKIIPEGLFGNSTLPTDVKPAIVMCDATYIFVQNSSNYQFQKDTYSLQKLDPFLDHIFDEGI